jgi:DNA mismatch repair protein MutS2
LSLDDLRRQRGATRPPDRPRAPASPLGTAADVTASTEISLRGLRVDEAEHQLTGALDAAIAGDAPFLRIIHGKGTGALRQLVHDLLARDKRVARFAFAPANQGGAGVTVAEFRA